MKLMNVKQLLIPHLPIIIKSRKVDISYKHIIQLLKINDHKLSEVDDNTLIKIASQICIQFSQNTLYSKYSLISVMLIPESEKSEYIDNTFYKYGSYHLSLVKAMGFYEKYKLTKEVLLDSYSTNIIDKLYAKRLMRWFEVDDRDLIKSIKSKMPVEKYNQLAQQNITTLENLDETYIKFYNFAREKLMTQFVSFN